MSDKVRWKSHVMDEKPGEQQKEKCNAVTLVVERPNYYAQTAAIRFVDFIQNFSRDSFS